MPKKLTARQYAQVRCLLIAAHAITLGFSIGMLAVALSKRFRYLSYFRIITEPDKDVNISSALMIASGAVALVQPLLFFSIHIAYPLVRQRQWALQYDRTCRTLETGQGQQQAPQQTYAVQAESPSHKSVLTDFMRTTMLTVRDSHLHHELSSTRSEAEGTPQGKIGTVKATSTVTTTAAAAAAASDASFSTPGLGPSLPVFPLSPEASLGLPNPSPQQDAHVFPAPPQKALMAPTDSCVTVTHRATSCLLSSKSSTKTERNVAKTVKSLSLSPSDQKETPVLENKVPVAAEVPSAPYPTSGYQPLYVCEAASSVGAGEAAVSRSRHNDAMAVVAVTSLITGDTGGGEGSPAVSDAPPPLHSYETCAMTKPPDKTTIYGPDGKASRHPREQSPNTVTKCRLDTPAYVDRSTLATVTEAAPHDAAYRSHSSPAQSTTDAFSTPSTSAARSSLRSRTLPLVSVRPSATSDTSGTQKACTDVFATPSKRSAPTLSPVVPTTRVLRTASVGDREVEALSSDEVQPPKSSIKEASQHGQPQLDCSGDFPQHRVPFAFSKVVTRFIPSCVTEETSSLQSDSAMRPPLALLTASVKPLPPALLHVYLKSEVTFRSLLTAYFIFGAMGTLLMHFFGVLWLIRRQLGGLNTLVSMAEGWGNVFAYQNVTPYVDAALCKVELDCRCSGGTSLCNATMYPSAEAAHNASCPFCEESQQTLISTFTQLCSIAYDPSMVYTKTYLVLLLLSVISSLVALCVAVYSCGAGVLASAGYATLSKQEEELEAQTAQEAGGLHSCTEKVPELHSSCTPTRTPSPLLHTFADKIPSPETPIAVAPSRERLMHTFEGLHAPSTALLPPLSVVIAEMSSSCGLVAPPGSTTN